MSQQVGSLEISTAGSNTQALGANNTGNSTVENIDSGRGSDNESANDPEGTDTVPRLTLGGSSTASNAHRTPRFSAADSNTLKNRQQTDRLREMTTEQLMEILEQDDVDTLKEIHGFELDTTGKLVGSDGGNGDGETDNESEVDQEDKVPQVASKVASKAPSASSGGKASNNDMEKKQRELDAMAAKMHTIDEIRARLIEEKYKLVSTAFCDFFVVLMFCIHFFFLI